MYELGSLEVRVFGEGNGVPFNDPSQGLQLGKYVMKNTGVGPVELLGITGEYVAGHDPTVKTLLPDEECNLQVGFKPGNPYRSARDAQFTVRFRDLATENVLEAPFVG